MDHLGELAAVGTALCWTGSSLFFGLASRRVGGLGVNQLRILAAVPALLLLHLLVQGSLWPADLPADRFRALCLSGIVGLVLGDIGFFYALAVIGPRISSVLMATWPSMALLLAWLLAGEAPAGQELGGVLLTMAGVVLVLLRAREGSAWNAHLTPRRRALAVLGALAGALGQAGAVVLARPAMAVGADLPDGVAPLSATLVRMTAACVGIFAVGLLRGRALAFRGVLADGRASAAAAAGTVFGPIVGVWLSMTAVRFAHGTGAAAALMATTPIWMMPVAWLVYRARIGWLGAVGTVLTVGGAGLLLWRA